MSRLSTQLIHHPYRPPEGFDAVAPGVHKASTVIFPNVHALRTQEWKDKSGYTYGMTAATATATAPAWCSSAATIWCRPSPPMWRG